MSTPAPSLISFVNVSESRRREKERSGIGKEGLGVIAINLRPPLPQRSVRGGG